jgi:uncharacterized protein
METQQMTDPGPSAEPPKKQRRGFGAMDRTKVREIARMGGTAAHRKGTAHRFTQEEAKEAGSKGGKAPHRTRGGKRKTPPQPAPAVPTE